MHISALFLLSLVCRSQKQLDLPALSIDFYPEPYDPFTSTPASGRSDVLEVFKHTQSLYLKSLADLGLAIIPGPDLDFGTQPLGTELCVTVRLTNRRRRDIVIEAITAQEPLQVTETEGAEVPISMLGRAHIAVKVCLLPKDYGPVSAKIYIKTNFGYGFQNVTARIEANEYLLGPVQMYGEHTGIMSLFNPHNSTLTVTDIKASKRSLQIILGQSTVFPSKSNIIAWIQVTDPTYALSGMIRIVTNFGSLLIPVEYEESKYRLTVEPSLIEFGIVVFENVAHAARVRVRNRGVREVNVTRVYADNEAIVVSMGSLVVGNQGEDVAVADLLFYPKYEGVFMGEITIEVENMIHLHCSYRGFSQLDLVKYHYKDLIFAPADFSSRSFHLNLNFPEPVLIACIYSLAQAFEFSPDHVTDTVGAQAEDNRYHMVMKKVKTNEFVIVESDIGVMALPVMVEEGNSFECVVVNDNQKCLFPYISRLGSVPIGETRRIKVHLTNTNYLPLHIFASCESPLSFVSIFTTTDGLTLEPLSDSMCRASRFHFLGPGMAVTVVVAVVIPEEMLGTLPVEIHISHRVLEMYIVWTIIPGDLVITPKSIHIENTFVGLTHHIPIIMEHSFKASMKLEKAMSNVDELQFVQHQWFVVPHAPVRTWDVVFPSWPGKLLDMSLADLANNVTDIEVKQWRLRMAMNNQTVEGKIVFRSDIVQEIEISFKAEFKPPTITNKRIDFGFVNLEDTRRRYFRVYNPGDKAVLIQSLLYRGKLCTKCDIAELLAAESASVMPESAQKTRTFRSHLEKEEVDEGAQSFFLSERGKMGVVLPAKQSMTLGPILFRPSHSGLATTHLYIRNNLTGFETVELTGFGSSASLRITMETERRRHLLTYREIDTRTITIDIRKEMELFAYGMRVGAFSRSYAVKNTGNKPMLVSNVALEGHLSSLHGVMLISQRNFLLHPGRHFEVSLYVCPSFAETNVTIDLWVDTGDEEVFVIPIELRVPETGLSEVVRVEYRDLLEYMLESVVCFAFGVLVSLISDLLLSVSSKKPNKKLHIEARVVKSIEDPAPMIHTPALKKKKPKRTTPSAPVPTPVPVPIVSNAEIQPLVPICAEPRFSKAVEIAEEHQGGEDYEDDEDFLDDYKANSCLFWGFNQDPSEC